ncbi:MAG: ATP-binding protein [Candidatus Limnocylindrales bacterium]
MAVKAAGGGGGKGFRVAQDGSELEAAFDGASREGEKFFSDPTGGRRRRGARPHRRRDRLPGGRQGGGGRGRQGLPRGPG